MSGELKPCPFCGDDAERIDIIEGENAGGSCVSCKRCSACGHVEFGRKENFVSCWNTRAPDPTLTAQVERLREEAIEALRPFADIARLDTSDNESDSDLFRPSGRHNLARLLTIGDLRKCRALIDKLAISQEENSHDRPWLPSPAADPAADADDRRCGHVPGVGGFDGLSERGRGLMGVIYHDQFEQGSQAWLDARCGLLTASEMKLIITPTLKVANNDKERAHLYELLAQRITKYVEPKYISDDMLRGQTDEIYARAEYEQRYAPVKECGFITNDEWGFTIGYSPDGLVGEDGAIEAKSRRAKYQVQTIIENMGIDLCETIPADYLMQHQTGMLVSKRQWIDFISYSGGLPTAVIRVHPDDKIKEAIINAAGEFERKLAEKLAIYDATVARYSLTPTERREEMEMIL